MPLVAAKCTQCGANIEVDDTKEAGIGYISKAIEYDLLAKWEKR